MSYEVFRCDTTRRRDHSGNYVAVVPSDTTQAALLVRISDVQQLRAGLLRAWLTPRQKPGGAFSRQESLWDEADMVGGE